MTDNGDLKLAVVGLGQRSYLGDLVHHPGQGSRVVALADFDARALARTSPRFPDVAILAESTEGMPGCLSYIVAKDATNADALWITEVWTDKDSHAASLKLPAVQAAIAKARPIIAGFGHRFETVPVGGVGPANA